MAELSMQAQEKKWQREYDARILVDAEVIKNDASRLKGAKAEAKKMAKEKQKEVKAMNRIAKTTKKTVAKPKATPKRAVAKKSKMVVNSNTKTPLSRSKKK